MCNIYNFRCNRFGDCEDESDEKNCKTISVDGSKYLKDKTPQEEDVEVTVFIDVDTSRILSIDEVEGTFEVQQSIILTWRDARIIFLDLKDDQQENSLLKSEKETIWTPSLTFLNTANLVSITRVLKSSDL